MPEQPGAKADELQRAQSGPLEEQKEPPVVARLVIEIRSDGTRTVARGALEDHQTGQRVELNAAGATPLQLIASLLKSLGDVPSLAKRAATLFLTGKPKQK